MKVGTEQGWQATRKELLAAERELEEHAGRVEQQRRELPWARSRRSTGLRPTTGRSRWASCSLGARSCSSTT